MHRKRAIPAASGEPGLIPGSMGTHSFHVEGRGCAAALCSSAHGAGRRLSRTDARRALSAKDVTRELRGVWFDRRLAAGLREEAPSAYKDVDAVLRAQKVLCFKGRDDASRVTRPASWAAGIESAGRGGTSRSSPRPPT